MKKLLALVLLTFLLTGCTTGNNENIVGTFNYAEIKHRVEVLADHSVGTNDDEVVYNFPTSLPEVDLWRRNQYHSDEYTDMYGVVLVIEIQQSENMLGKEVATTNGWERKELKKDRVYSEIKSISQMDDVSFTKSQAVVKEILYQPTGSNIGTGDIVAFCEPYYILDDRVPNVRKSNNNMKLQLAGAKNWCPAEATETYIIFGYYWARNQGPYIDSQMLHGTIWGDDYGIYCLSSPDKQGGIQKDAKILADGIAYLKQNYDLSKYGLK